MAPQNFQLVMRTGPNPGKVHELSQDEITIGRDIANNIVVNDPEVSRKHTRFRAQGGTYVVEDMGSTNGTFVNGQRLMGPHVLRHGEQVMLGEHVAFVFESMAFDPNATLISGTGAGAGISRETYRVVPPTEPSAGTAGMDYQPAYSGQIPAGPADYMEQPATPYEMAYEEVPEEKKSRSWVLVGGGVLIALCCVCAAGAYAFDAMNLYCSGPFRAIMSALGFACP